MRRYRAGMDVGSTTVKLVLLDEEGKTVFGAYERHCAHTQETLAELLAQARKELGNCILLPAMTGRSRTIAAHPALAVSRRLILRLLKSCTAQIPI